MFLVLCGLDLLDPGLPLRGRLGFESESDFRAKHPQASSDRHFILYTAASEARVEEVRYPEKILTLHSKWYPLFRVVQLLILPLDLEQS